MTDGHTKEAIGLLIFVWKGRELCWLSWILWCFNLVCTIKIVRIGENWKLIIKVFIFLLLKGQSVFNPDMYNRNCRKNANMSGQENCKWSVGNLFWIQKNLLNIIYVMNAVFDWFASWAILENGISLQYFFLARPLYACGFLLLSWTAVFSCKQYLLILREAISALKFHDTFIARFYWDQ